MFKYMKNKRIYRFTGTTGDTDWAGYIDAKNTASAKDMMKRLEAVYNEMLIEEGKKTHLTVEKRKTWVSGLLNRVMTEDDLVKLEIVAYDHFMQRLTKYKKRIH